MYSAAFLWEPGAYDAEFNELNALIEAVARSIPGFLGVEEWSSDDGKRKNATYYWDSLESLQVLAEHPKHLEAKSRYSQCYNGYHVVISKVVRSYGDAAFPHFTSSTTHLADFKHPHIRPSIVFAPVIVALDFPSHPEAMALVDKLGHACSSYKVGLQLLTEEGPEVVRELVGLGKNVFLDLKLHEIPDSVASAVRAAGKLGVGMVTVHASAGSAVLRAAVAAAAEYPNLKVLALTVITSLTDKELPEIGLTPSVRQQVERLAKLAAQCGCHGVVASAHEAAYLTALLEPGALIVTPGIQLAGASANDQTRVATPEFARRAGATHVVIGRSITQAASPHAAFVSATASMAAVSAGYPSQER